MRCNYCGVRTEDPCQSWLEYEEDCRESEDDDFISLWDDDDGYLDRDLDDE